MADLRDAIIKSMKMYWKGDKEHDSLETSKGRKFTKKYFDSLKESGEEAGEKPGLKDENMEKKRGY